MPEKPSGDGAIRMPGRGHFFEFFRGGAFAKMLHFFDGRSESEIADGPDIRPAERGEEINVGGPAAYTFEGDKHFARGIIVETAEIAKVKVTAGQRIGEKARVKRFLAAEADAEQFCVAES